MPRPVKDFLALTSFLTIVPTGVHDINAAARSLYMVPLVGLIVGAVSAAPLMAGARLSSLSILVAYALTGLLHMEGLADVADAVLSGARGDEFLRILKDPRRGGKAVASVAVAVGAAFSLTNYLGGVEGGAYLFVAATAAAYEALYLGAYLGEPPTYEGLASVFIPEAKKRLSANALALAVTALLFIPFPRALAAYAAGLSASGLVSLVLTRVSIKRSGFVNGDVIGACMELGRVASLTIAAVVGGL